MGVQTYVVHKHVLLYRRLTYDTMNLRVFITMVVAKGVKIEYYKGYRTTGYKLQRRDGTSSKPQYGFL